MIRRIGFWLLLGTFLGLGLLPAVSHAAPLVYVQILARPDGTDDPFSSTISPTSVGEEYDYIVVATMAPAGTINLNLPVDPGTGLQSIDHYVSGAGTTSTVPTTDGLQAVLYSAYEATNQTTQVNFQTGPSPANPLLQIAGYQGAGGNNTIDGNIFSGLNMRRSTGSGSQVNGNALFTGGVNTQAYGYTVSGQQGTALTLKPTSLTSQSAGYALFNNYGAGTGSTPGTTADRGNGYNDLVTGKAIGPSPTGYYGIDPNTGTSSQTTTTEKPYTVILSEGSNTGGPTYGSVANGGAGDANGNDTTFVVSTLSAGTSTLNLNAQDLNPGNPGGALTPTTNFLNIEYHNSQGTLVQPGIASSFQYGAQLSADPVVSYTGLTIIGTGGNTSVLAFQPNTTTVNVLSHSSYTFNANLNNTPTNGTDTGNWTSTSTGTVTGPGSGTAAVGNNNVALTVTSGADAAQSTAGTFTVTNTSNSNDGPDANQTMTVNTVVGNAGADTTNNMNAFGPALFGTVSAGTSFKNLDSTVVGSSSGPIQGGPLEFTTATIVQGQNNSGVVNNVSMAWRSRTLNETSIVEGGTPTTPPLPEGPHSLISDVVNLSLGESNPTSVFALQMNYENLGNNENLLAGKGLIYLAWLNPTGFEGTTPLWVNAVNGNTGAGGTVNTDVLMSYSAWATANGVTDANIGNFLGSWGVDTADHEVWAVLNHNSQFAVVPEPAAIALAAIGLLGLLAARRRKES